MNAFSQKLQLIYGKLFHENIDKFTEALIDHQKFESHKFEFGSESQKRQQFFNNRKTVLRRWLSKGSTCTSDFQKSFNNYKLKKLELFGSPLFTLEDFQKEDNLKAFNEKLEKYLQKERQLEVQTDYAYLYLYDEIEEKIHYYHISQWQKSDQHNATIIVEAHTKRYRGNFNLTQDNNIFITLSIDENTRYFLFHDNQDKSSNYIVGMSMGYFAKDNKTPCSQKVIFSKEKLQENTLSLHFILNETQTLSAIENRLHHQEFNKNPLIKYAKKFQKYLNFFNKLKQKEYQRYFYQRLAFREFNSINALFKKLAKEESYYIYDYQEAFLELLCTVEEIKNIPLQIVMELNEQSFLLQSNKKSLAIKKRLLNLKHKANIQSTIIFVLQENEPFSPTMHKLLSQMKKHNITVKTIEEFPIAHEINSLNFSFIHLNSKEDFVLADPIRDSKDVYKIFIDELTMEEYRLDYYKILEQSDDWTIE